jgi:hypothetical protein
MVNEKLKIAGEVHMVLRGPDGAIKEDVTRKNLVVTAGTQFIASRLEGVSSAVMSHMAVGSGITAAQAADIDVESILGVREALDTTTVVSNTVQYVCGFEAGEGTGAVTEAGLFNASSGGTMLCRTTFPVVNKQADDVLTITWTITISAA